MKARRALDDLFIKSDCIDSIGARGYYAPFIADWSTLQSVEISSPFADKNTDYPGANVTNCYFESLSKPEIDY